MNRNSKNKVDKCKDHKEYGLRKVNFWEKYGVKCFPYRGRRRYSPFAYQSVDGGIVISNDVFGLTIRQFEQLFKACINRRKTHEQYILNLRYPDKTADEYLEYLQDFTERIKDDNAWTRNSLQEKFLYERLVETSGTETVIRQRQQLVITRDIIQNAIMQQIGYKVTKISSGSVAEEMDLPGSDIDIMYVIEDVDVIRDVKNIKRSVKRTTLVLETEQDHPGFFNLRLVAGGDGESIFLTSKCFEFTSQGLYLSVDTFVSNINEKVTNFKLSSHGPSLSDIYQYMDYVFCLRSKYIPFNAILWVSRYRLQWPPNYVMDKIRKTGCLSVPIGPRTLPDCKLLWRISFSLAEKLLVHSFNFTQLVCYCLLKLTLKYIVNTNKGADGLLCSYFLKTALFWVSEEVDINTFHFSKLYSVFSHCLSKLLLWVKDCYCPNYFIPEQNMFHGKISPDNNEILLSKSCAKYGLGDICLG